MRDAGDILRYKVRAHPVVTMNAFGGTTLWCSVCDAKLAVSKNPNAYKQIESFKEEHWHPEKIKP